MSGHSGFQPIGGGLPPIVPQPQAGGVQGTGQAQEPKPPVVSGENAPSPGPETQLSEARSLARKLDAMLLRAAKMSTRTVDGDSLKSTLDAAKLDKAARNRLDEAIALAEKLAREGKVVRNADFSRQDVQNRILRRELLVSPNPVKPVAGYELSPANEIVKRASRQSRSLLFRDLVGFVAKQGWFS